MAGRGGSRTAPAPAHSMHPDLSPFEDKLSYHFRRIDRLRQAVVHKSYANERRDKGIADNERLEFLGDAVLDLIISEAILERYPLHSEGQLSKLRALIVSEPTLARIARSIGLGEFILLGRGEEQTGGRDKNSILADTIEAVIAAVYLDSDLATTAAVVLPLLREQIEGAASNGSLDYKTSLQESSQSLKGALPVYRVVKESGPDHQKVFQVELTIQERVYAVGKGRSKKEAEQDAARAGLERLRQQDVQVISSCCLKKE